MVIWLTKGFRHHASVVLPPRPRAAGTTPGVHLLSPHHTLLLRRVHFDQVFLRREDLFNIWLLDSLVLSSMTDCVIGHRSHPAGFIRTLPAEEIESYRSSSTSTLERYQSTFCCGVVLSRMFGDTSTSCRISSEERADADLRLREGLTGRSISASGVKSLCDLFKVELSAALQQRCIHRDRLKLPLVLSP